MLSGEPRGQARLREMESRDLFLRRVDPDGDWFRYHPLFVEFLRRRLERDHAELVIPLHRKASEWFERHGMLVEAVQHSLAAFDEEHAVELVEEHGEELITFSQMGVLLDLTAKLPRTMVRSRPRIQLLTAWSNVMLGRPRCRGGRALSRLDDAVEAMGVTPKSPRPATSCAPPWMRSPIEPIASTGWWPMSSTVRRTSLRSTWPAAANLATISATARFDYEQAHRWQEWAVPFHRENIGQYAVMYGNALDGIAWMEQLELDRAEERFRDALAVSTRSGPTHLQSARLASAPCVVALRTRRTRRIGAPVRRELQACPGRRGRRHDHRAVRRRRPDRGDARRPDRGREVSRRRRRACAGLRDHAVAGRD